MDDKEQPRDLLDWMRIRNAPDWRVARPLGPLFTMVFAALFIGAIAAAFAVIGHTVTNAFGSAPGGPSLGAGAMIAALLGAPFLIWSTVLKHQTLRYQKEGHITDRITSAVEQLGAEKTEKGYTMGADGKPIQAERTVPNIEVRIGALLSLERIAQDSTTLDKGRDHVRVMEILCAYVRENSNARVPVEFPLPDWEPLAEGADAEARTAHEAWRKARFARGFDSNAREWAQSLPKPRSDIVVALQVLGRRTAEQRLVEAAWPEAPEASTVWPFDTPCPELREGTKDAPLTGAEITAFKEKLAAWRETLGRYSGYRLDLRGANLQGADLSAKRPDAADAVFSGALLAEARMQGADLGRARMEGADLGQARMEGADLSGARMEGADLYRARMEGADLSGARMEGADLYRARMEGADLRLARMEGAVLRLARMDASTLLTEASLRDASVKSVDYTPVTLSREQIDSMFGDASVILPKGMTRPTHWPGWELPWGGDHAFNTEWRKWQADPEGYEPPPAPAD